MKKNKIKKLLAFVLVGIVSVCLATSCVPDDTTFDETLLIGKWKSNSNSSLFYKYSSNGSGSTWNESEDVSESEASKFTWTLIEDELTQIHIMETGGSSIPKVYTVTTLTSTKLAYSDEFSNSYSFTKVD